MKESQPKPNQLIVISKEASVRSLRLEADLLRTPTCRGCAASQQTRELFRRDLERHDKHACGVFHMEIAAARVSGNAFELLGRLGDVGSGSPPA